MWQGHVTGSCDWVMWLAAANIDSWLNVFVLCYKLDGIKFPNLLPFSELSAHLRILFMSRFTCSRFSMQMLETKTAAACCIQPCRCHISDPSSDTKRFPCHDMKNQCSLFTTNIISFSDCCWNWGSSQNKIIVSAQIWCLYDHLDNILWMEWFFSRDTRIRVHGSGGNDITSWECEIFINEETGQEIN